MTTDRREDPDLAHPAVAALHELLASARDAFRRRAFHQAAAELRQALQVIQTSPEVPISSDFALACHLGLGTILGMTQGHSAPEVKAIYETALDLCTPGRPETALILRFQIAMQHGQVTEALEATERMAEAAGSNPSLQIAAQMSRGWPELMSGDPASAIASMEAARRLVRASNAVQLPEIMAEHPLILSGGMIAIARTYLGQLDTALAAGLENLADARALASPYDELLATVYLIGISKWRRDWVSTRDYAEEALAMTERFGLPYWTWYASLDHGWALYQLGETELGTAEMEASGAQLEVVGARLIRTIFCNQMSLVYLQRGQYHLAQDLLVTGVADAQRRGERLYTAESHRILGILADAIGDRDRARSEFGTSLEISRAAGAKLYELLTLSSLARLMAAEGRGFEASELLRPAYAKFPEGHDTPLLREIAQQLEDL